jgi:hypothetical protein
VIFASDQNLDIDRLSTTSRKMLELYDDVFDEWEDNVRASIKEAGSLSRPVLIDTLPALYVNLAEALTPAYRRTSGDTAVTS